MKQRVAVARAYAYEPQFMLMDEPFGALDAQTRENLQSLTVEVWEKTKKTIFYVTHNLSEAVYLADRIIVLAGQPGVIHKEIIVDVPRPRDPFDPEGDRTRTHGDRGGARQLAQTPHKNHKQRGRPPRGSRPLLWPVGIIRYWRCPPTSSIMPHLTTVTFSNFSKMNFSITKPTRAMAAIPTSMNAVSRSSRLSKMA